MPRIRLIEIENFRCIKRLKWCPGPGLNCLIGPGDSGKSTVLDAIDLCLGARRTVQFTDADFHRVQVEFPIRIAITVGDLDDPLRALDAYGLFLRSFHAQRGEVEDEPGNGGETVLTIVLTVGGDLEPSWTLYSERAAEQDQTRLLSWSDRVRVAPTSIGAAAGYHLTWRRGSVLNRLSDERAEIAAALAKAGRDARLAFGDGAADQLRETLTSVAETAGELGIATGPTIRALIDPESVSFSGGTISAHDHDGVPLGAMGTGSARLLIAALQQKTLVRSSIVVLDEMEHGLEPHRILQLLRSLGAKTTPQPLQVFASTHSPVVLRELTGDQLLVLRPSADGHECRLPGTADEVQGTLRKHPEAFLGRSVLICEGASEVGLLFGLDGWRVSGGNKSLLAQGVVPVDVRGEGELLRRAGAFQRLGYRVSILRDDDVPPDPAAEVAFVSGGGVVFHWGDRRAIEDALFQGLPNDAIATLLELAVELHDEELIDEHLKSATNGEIDLAACRSGITPATRSAMATAAKASRNGRKAGWFKTVSRMERVGGEVVGPNLAAAESWFQTTVNMTLEWAARA